MFVFYMVSIIDVFDPIWKDPVDAEMYVTRRNQHRLHQFFMALIDDFEPVRVQLLHRSPLPNLDTTIFELVLAENRLQTIRSQSSHTVLATPSSGSFSFQREQFEPFDNFTLYRHLVGSLVYLTVTRPDISYVVHQVSQFMAAPRSTHFSTVLRILWYLKGTLFHGLYFSSQSPP
jgi:hypothetical protein